MAARALLPGLWRLPVCDAYRDAAAPEPGSAITCAGPTLPLLPPLPPPPIPHPTLTQRPPSTPTPWQVSEADIKRAQRAEREAEKMRGTLRARFDFLDE